MNNKSFTIKCDNCDNEVVLKDGMDIFHTDIKINPNRYFSMDIECTKCSNEIETNY